MKLLRSEHDPIPQDVVDEINDAVARAASELFVNIQRFQHTGATSGENWDCIMRVFEYHARKGLRDPDYSSFPKEGPFAPKSGASKDES